MSTKTESPDRNARAKALMARLDTLAEPSAAERERQRRAEHVRAKFTRPEAPPPNPDALIDWSHLEPAPDYTDQPPPATEAAPDPRAEAMLEHLLEAAVKPAYLFEADSVPLHIDKPCCCTLPGGVHRSWNPGDLVTAESGVSTEQRAEWIRAGAAHYPPLRTVRIHKLGSLNYRGRIYGAPYGKLARIERDLAELWCRSGYNYNAVMEDVTDALEKADNNPNSLPPCPPPCDGDNYGVPKWPTAKQVWVKFRHLRPDNNRTRRGMTDWRPEEEAFELWRDGRGEFLDNPADVCSDVMIDRLFYAIPATDRSFFILPEPAGSY